MKKENGLITFIKGFIIGLGIIFPISASGLAISMGLYERILYVINNIKESLKKDLAFVIPFFIGVVCAALASCLAVNFTYKKFPIATLLLFAGLIVGGFPPIIKKTNKEYKFKNIIWLIIGMLTLVGISFIGEGKTAIITMEALSLVKVFLAGVLAAGTMIIPGVSGSLILVIIGYYEPMLNVISNIVKFNNLPNNLLIAFIFGIGMILGLLVCSKLMDYFLKKHERKSYFTIVGFVFASIINMIILICGYSCSVIELIIGILLLVLGFFISFKFLKEE